MSSSDEDIDSEFDSDTEDYQKEIVEKDKRASKHGNVPSSIMDGTQKEIFPEREKSSVSNTLKWMLGHAQRMKKEKCVKKASKWNKCMRKYCTDNDRVFYPNNRQLQRGINLSKLPEVGP